MANPKFPNQITANQITGGFKPSFSHQPPNNQFTKLNTAQQKQQITISQDLQNTLSQINSFQSSTTHPSHGLHGQSSYQDTVKRYGKLSVPTMYASLTSSFGLMNITLMNQKAKELKESKKLLAELKIGKTKLKSIDQIQIQIEKTKQDIALQQQQLNDYQTGITGKYLTKGIGSSLITPGHVMGGIGAGSVSLSQALSLKNLQTLQKQVVIQNQFKYNIHSLDKNSNK